MNNMQYEQYVIVCIQIKIDWHNLRQKQIMKSLTNKKPLCYMLENSHLVASLPFIDEEITNQIPKSKVAYFIKAEQNIMQKDHHQYIHTLEMPELEFADSQGFKLELERVRAKFQDKEKVEKKRKEVIFEEVPKKLLVKQHATVSEKLKNNVLTYENAINKNINLELYKKFGPLILKELIEVLQKEKTNLLQKIQTQKTQIYSLNQNRKYQQTQCYQREYDINQRIKIMLNKRKKME